MCQKLHMFFLYVSYLTVMNNKFLMCLFFVLWQIRKPATHDMIRAFNIKNFLNLTGIQKGIINRAKVVFLRKHIKRKAKFIISKTIVNNKRKAYLCSILESYCFCSLNCRILHYHNFYQLFFFASLEFVTLFRVIKKPIEKKMANKLSRWGGCGSYFPGNQVKLNFNVVHVVVVVVIVVVHVVVVAVHVVVAAVVVVVVMKNKVIHVIGWNWLTFDFDLRYKKDNRWPQWLKALLEENFFKTCKLHRGCPKYWCNMYCLDCMNDALCTISIQNHKGHCVV